jgi:Kelch motif protein
MAGSWQSLTHQPNFNMSTMILLSDGRVMVQEEATPHWHALTPDNHGSYINGTWSTLADMSFWRRYYASGMLRDGRIVLIGGEQSGAGGDTNKGEIYDPVSDTWSAIPSPPGWTEVGDASCCILPDGRLMIGALSSPQCTIYDLVSNSWLSAANKAIRSNEETWVLLPDDTILTAQCFPPYRSERYSISSNSWKDEGSIPVDIVDHVMAEIGPAILLYNGKVIYFGAANVAGFGKTAIYTPPALYTGTGSWTQGPDIPKLGGDTMVCNDCPASLLPNGKVLVACAPFAVNNWGAPIAFLEYDPFTNTLQQAPTPPNNNAQLYWSRLMLLPTGQVLFSPSSSNVQCYTPDGVPRDAWRPAISSVEHQGLSPSTVHYLLKGTQLNGLSQANMYGDDCNPSTNYPLVCLRNSITDHVFFARTYDFSTRGVATGASLQSVRFSAAHIPYGDYELCVIANGISSHCIIFGHHPPLGPCRCEQCCHQKSECCNRQPICEEEKVVPPPEIVALRRELHRLSRGLDRFASHIKVEEPHREPKEVKRSEKPPRAQGARKRGPRKRTTKRSS